MIRVTGGTLRGRILPAAIPNGVRPTSSRAREALFSILGQDLSGLSFLDLFAGSGAISIEAASRGASPVVAVERAAASLGALRKNLAATGAPVDVHVADVARGGFGEFDIVYLDPPFADPIAPWVDLAARHVRQQLVAEARAGAEFPSMAGHIPLDRVRGYGDTALAVYRHRVD